MHKGRRIYYNRSHMNSETKLFLGIILSTVAIIAGAAFIFSRPANAPTVNPDVLVREDSHKVSSPSATVTMVEFGDFQCPACGAYHTVVKQLMQKYASSVSLVFRNYPLPAHQNAMISALAAEAAGKQGKYWLMYDKLYESQSEWGTSDKARDFLIGYAKDMNLDVKQFTADLDNEDLKKRINNDVTDGNVLGINATPTFFLNNVQITNPASVAEFDALVKAAIDKSPTPAISKSEDYHVHANISVVINGKAIDFSQAKYQSEEGKELNDYIHFHDGKGDLVHIHKKGMTLGDLFTSLNMSLTKDCIVSDEKTAYCGTGDKSVKLFVNGKANTSFDRYEPQDLDKILVTYGNESVEAVAAQMSKVADDACIYSLKCPERGKPPTENCVGGLGSTCK